MLSLKQLMRRIRLIAEDWHVPSFLEMDIDCNVRLRTIAVWLSIRNPSAKTLDLCEVIPVDEGPLFLGYQQFLGAITALTDQLEAVIIADQGEDDDEVGPLFDVELMGRDQ